MDKKENRGGKREGAGRKAGSTKDRVKLGISISRENAEWLRGQKEQGKNISALIDEAIQQYSKSLTTAYSGPRKAVAADAER